MYQQQRLQSQQPIIPVSYESPKTQIGSQNFGPRQPVQNAQTTTFPQYSLPIPTQIQQQRLTNQQIISQQQQFVQQQQQSYVHQVQQNQRQRFVNQNSPQNTFLNRISSPDQKVKLPENRDPVLNQGGQAPGKPWMGDDVYLVAFLLGIEVDRLREESDQLWEEKEAVEQKARAYAIVENELRESRQKMGDYEKKIALLESELDGLRSKTLTREKDFEDTRYQQEFSKRALVDREIRELTAKFISDRNYLENENRKLRQDLDELRLKHGSIDDIILSAEQIQTENSRLRQELEKFREGFEQLEYVFKTVQELEQENEQMKKILQTTGRNSNNQEVTQRILQLEQENDQLRRSKGNESQIYVEDLQRQLQMFEAENRRLRERTNPKPVAKHEDSAFCY